MYTIGTKGEYKTYNANTIYDSEGKSICLVYGIASNYALEDLNERDAEGLENAKKIVNALNEQSRLSDLQAVADKMAERLKANKEVTETHKFEDGYINAHKELIFGRRDAEALSAYEKLMEQK